MGAWASGPFNVATKERPEQIDGSAETPGFFTMLGRAMQSTLYGVAAFDGRAFAGVAFVLLVAALLACFFPAWRASRVEPMVALRYE